jgi:hypothetical protein
MKTLNPLKLIHITWTTIMLSACGKSEYYQYAKVQYAPKFNNVFPGVYVFANGPFIPFYVIVLEQNEYE